MPAPIFATAGLPMTVGYAVHPDVTKAARASSATAISARWKAPRARSPRCATGRPSASFLGRIVRHATARELLDDPAVRDAYLGS
jgi:hypothetical protein